MHAPATRAATGGAESLPHFYAWRIGVEVEELRLPGIYVLLHRILQVYAQGLGLQFVTHRSMFSGIIQSC